MTFSFKFNHIPETPPRSSGEDGQNTEEVLRDFLEKELGYADDNTVEIQRVHRLRKRRNEGPRPILAIFLRSKDVENIILSLGSLPKGTNFQMFRGLPQELVDRRKAQMDNYRNAKKNGIPVSFSRSKPDQL